MKDVFIRYFDGWYQEYIVIEALFYFYTLDGTVLMGISW